MSGAVARASQMIMGAAFVPHNSEGEIMKRLWMVLALLLAVPFAAVQAWAKVEVNVDLSTQRMHVKVDGRPYATWRISSGRRKYYTPRGTYRPKWLKRMHYSRKYDNAPMPYSIFFRGGYAIHGTNIVSRLGRPASHGCIRLSPSNAATLFNLVQQHGRKNTIIRITGSTDVAYANLPKPRKVKRRLVKRRKYRGRRYTRRRHVRHVRHARRHHRPRFDFLQVYGAVLFR